MILLILHFVVACRMEIVLNMFVKQLVSSCILLPCWLPGVIITILAIQCNGNHHYHHCQWLTTKESQHHHYCHPFGNRPIVIVLVVDNWLKLLPQEKCTVIVNSIVNIIISLPSSLLWTAILVVAVAIGNHNHHYIITIAVDRPTVIVLVVGNWLKLLLC